MNLYLWCLWFNQGMWYHFLHLQNLRNSIMTLLYCNTFGPNIEQKYHCFVLVIIIEICLLGRTYGVKLVLLLVQILNKSTSTLFNDNNQLKLQLWQGRHSFKVEEIFCRCIIFNLFKTFLCLTIIVKIDWLNKPWVYKYVTISVNYATLTYIFLIFPFYMRNGTLFSVILSQLLL